MENLKWEGNSKMMYGAILKATPELLQGGIKRLVTTWVKKHKVDVVTEDMVFEVLDDIAPSEARDKIGAVLETMRSE